MDLQPPSMVRKPGTRKKKGGDRTPRLIKMIPEVERALHYAWDHRVKESPWVFTNEDMLKKYPGEPRKWAYHYRDKFLGTLPACRGSSIHLPLSAPSHRFYSGRAGRIPAVHPENFGP
jgi:hypothetical protein